VSPEPAAPQTHRVERALATMSATVIGLAVIAIAAILIGNASGADFSQGFWTVIVAIPLIALPIGLLLLISFIIVSGVRRQRASRPGQG
jgi:di/tricarboxylate transporter